MINGKPYKFFKGFQFDTWGQALAYLGILVATIAGSLATIVYLLVATAA